MEKIRTLDELEKSLGSLVDELSETDDAMLIERQGAPRAAIISIAEYRDYRELKERRRRQEAFAELEKLRLEIAECLADLTDEERQQLADEISADVDDRIAARFQRTGQETIRWIL